MEQRKKLISIVTPCYNEEDNIAEMAKKIKSIMQDKLSHYEYEHIIIDNDSKDNTQAIVRELAKNDTRIKAIFNSRNFGHIRSPVYGLYSANGDAAILMASDFQDPPDLLPEIIAKWEEGFPIVKCVKNNSEETPLMYFLRSLFYNFINNLSDIELTKNFTGFGLYDKKILDALRSIADPYPYFRGLISEIGFKSAIVYFTQPCRKRGITKNNFYTLYDMAMLGITNHSKIPLRLMILIGCAMGLISMLIGFGYLVAKLLFWDAFQAGTAPILIGIFILTSLQLFCVGIIGEYIGSIQTQVQKRPMVIEKERINF